MAFLDLIAVPGTQDDPKVTLFDAKNPAHAGLQKYAFLVDTGADHSLVRPDTRALLTRNDTFPGVHCTGIVDGATLPVLGSGYLDFVFPGHAPSTRAATGSLVNAFDRTLAGSRP